MSYRALPPGLARAYRLLGLHPGPQFGLGAAAAALDTSIEETTGVLTALTHNGLLREAGPLRYEVPTGHQAHARYVAATAPDRDEAVRRIVEWYVATAEAAGDWLTPYRRRIHTPPTPPTHDPVAFAGTGEAWRWLRAERGNLILAAEAAAGDLPELAYALTQAMTPLLYAEPHHPARGTIEQIGLDSARRLNNPALLAAATRTAAHGARHAGQLHDATALFGQGLRLAQQARDWHQIVAALDGLGQVALEQHQYDTAVDYFTREAAAAPAGHSRDTALALLHLGHACRLAGQPTTAVDHLTAAQQIFDNLARAGTGAPAGRDAHNAAHARLERGLALAAAGKHRQATRALLQALEQATQLRDRRGQAHARQALGELAVAAGDPTAALTHLTAALDLLAALHDPAAAHTRNLLTLVQDQSPTPIAAASRTSQVHSGPGVGGDTATRPNRP